MDGEGTGDTMMGGGEERGAPEGPSRDSRERDGDGRHPHEDAKEVVCGDGAREDHCHCPHVDFLIGSYPRVGKDALIQRIDKLDDTTGRILEDQAIFDNALKSIRCLSTGLRGQAGDNAGTPAGNGGQNDQVLAER